MRVAFEEPFSNKIILILVDALGGLYIQYTIVCIHTNIHIGYTFLE